VTLVLTELTPFGIAMAADSTVTFTDSEFGRCFARPNAAEKLQAVPYLNAGVSCWGLGEIDGVSTDTWLSRFITEHAECKSLTAFAQRLAGSLRESIGPSISRQPRLGFHVAGFEMHEGEPVPSFYHVHDGPSTTLASRGLTVDPSQVNANHDIPPEEFLKRILKGGGWITRNGNYQLYGLMFGMLEDFFAQLATKAIVIPHSQDLRDRAEYLVFQIRTVADVYRMSNLHPGIGGAIKFLTISPRGLHSVGTSYH
jgi:hypothetical protein